MVNERVRAVTLLLLFCAIGLSTRTSHAGDWPTAAAADRDGRAAFSRGDYEQAVAAFARAYELDPDPRLAANLGEAHRRLGHCREALRFFNVYLESAAPSPARADIARRVDDLEKQCPAGEPATPGSSPKPKAPPPAQSVEAPAPVEPRVARWRFGLDAGLSLGRWGDARSTSPSVRAVVGRTWRRDSVELEVGGGLLWSTFGYASLAVAPEPYERRAQMIEVLAEARGRWHAASWIAIRLDLGVGVAWYSGFDAWNELSPDGAAASAGASPAVRGALGLEVPLGASAWDLCLTAFGLSWHPVASTPSDSIALQTSLGVGYRF